MKIKLFVILIILLISSNSQAQLEFQNHIVNDSSNKADIPISVVSADIDGDGDNDILYGSLGDDRIIWKENLDGQGTFGPHQIIDDITLGVEFVYVADLDGDGDLDVLATFYQDNNVNWYENTDGNGTFSSAKVITTSINGGKAVVTSDIDGDGDLDVLSASRNDNKVAWYENTNGLGDFGIQQVITTSLTWAASVRTGDLDGDGDMDVISTSVGDDKIAWYENTDGQGNFGSQQVIEAVNNPNEAIAVDIDGDGDNDIIATLGTDDKVIWYENTNGLASFSPQKLITDQTDGANDVVAIDIDNDGDLDILTSSNSDDKIAWCENDGAGNFGTQQIITTNAEFALSVHASDIDSDGRIDVVSASRGDNKVAWYRNKDGQGNFGYQRTLTTSALGANVVLASDIDGDGDLDVISSSDLDNRISWYKNKDGRGSFNQQEQICIVQFHVADKPSFVSAGDIDGDGDNDVIFASYDDESIGWCKNIDGYGTFEQQAYINQWDAEGVRSVYLSDIDGDNDLDVLSATYSNSTISWYKNIDGQGTFGSEQIITNTGVAGADYVIAGDVDNDGDMDVISASNSNDTVAWYKNTDGLGNFGAQIVIDATLDGIQSVNLSDLDGDGDLDVITASQSDDTVAWFENTDGQGSFGAKQIITDTANTARSVNTFDLDGDGDLDVISASRNNDTVAWYENIDGQGTFGVPQVITNTADGATFVFPVDLDGDGDGDIISASEEDHTIAWYENEGNSRNEINGTIRLDGDLNGCDNSDDLMQDFLVVTDNGTESFGTFSLNNGVYQLFPNTGNYTTEIVTELPEYYYSTPGSYTNNITGIGTTITNDFCIELDQTINDANIVIYPTSDARPGFDASYRIVYENLGTTILNGNVTLEFDEVKLNFLTASETVSSQTSNTITFNYSSLNRFETRIIDVNFNVLPPPTVNIDEELNFTATVNPVSSDYIPEDNVFSIKQTVIGSYDPNDITCLEGEEILLADANKYLHYVIRFQNTGTAHAIKVKVDNVLDDKLDWNTLQLESMSHDGRVEIKNGNQVSFIFDAIYLPDSTNDEPGSHGFIAYKIKPKNDVAIGDIFSNTAHIFFDFNPAIVTNTATTEIVNLLGVENYNLSNYSVSPNPTFGNILINSKTAIVKIEVYNYLGQLIKENENKKNINISNFEAGLYFVKIKDIKGDVGMKKIIKL